MARSSLGSDLELSLPLSEDGRGAWEITVIELSSKQAREKCHQTLVAGLRLIRPEERVTAVAAAMQEVKERESRRHASDAGPRFLDS
jgi:hypothetical protein